MNHQEIKDVTRLRFYLLNGDKIIAEALVCIPGLRIGFPELFKKAQGILETFVNLCLDKWAEAYDQVTWNVGLFAVLLAEPSLASLTLKTEIPEELETSGNSKIRIF